MTRKEIIIASHREFKHQIEIGSKAPLSVQEGFVKGAEYMLARVLDFMRDFQDGNGEFPLWNYIGNVKKAMEE